MSARPRGVASGTPVALWLFAASALVRGLYVWSVADEPMVRLPIGDSLAYHQRALEILGGQWLGDEVFYQDPLYPYLLALLYRAFGVGSLGVLLAQALLDSLSVLFVYWTARELFGARCALVAGLLAAGYRVFLFYDAFLLKVPLTLLLAAATAYLLVRADARPAPAAWLAAGLALGLAALTRGNYLAFAPILVGWAWARGAAGRQRARFAAAAAAGLVLAIAPATLRNRLVGDDFVLVTSQAGQNFYIGNQRANDTGAYQAPAFVVANAAHEQGDFREEARRRTGEALAPSALSRFWLREGLREIAADPAHFARHTGRKLLLFANAWEVPDNQSYAFFQRHVSWLLRVPTPGYGLLLPLALVGAFRARRQRGAWLLALFTATYAASVTLFFVVSRYRIPALPGVLVFAAHGLAELVRSARGRQWRPLGVALAIFAGGLAVTSLPLVDEDFALHHANVGAAYARQAREHRARALESARAGDAEGARREQARADLLFDNAQRQYRRGLDLQRHSPRLRTALKDLLLARLASARDDGRIADALVHADALTASFPRFAEGFALQGELYEGQGDAARARGAYGRALGISPGNRRARAALARLRPAAEAGDAEADAAAPAPGGGD